MVDLEGFLWGIESEQSKALKDTYQVVNMATEEGRGEEVRDLSRCKKKSKNTPVGKRKTGTWRYRESSLSVAGK